MEQQNDDEMKMLKTFFAEHALEVVYGLKKELAVPLSKLLTGIYDKLMENFDYKKAYVGNLSIVWAFILHIILFIINFVFSFNLSSINFDLLNFKNLSYFFQFTFPNLIYLIYELEVTWICYSYTKNLSDGNDALVDGQKFDRYIEDLRYKLSFSDFEVLKSIISCLIFIHSKDSIEVFGKETAQKYLM